jgi:hypothetical protein
VGVKNWAVLPVDEELPDGSYLSRIYAARDKNRHADPEAVRVIEYTLDDSGTVYRLMTTILDPEQAPAADLAALYAQRWVLSSSSTSSRPTRAPPEVLRSQAPPGVEQEAWGFLLVHYAVRALMARAAAADLDPDRLSFTRTLRIARRQVTAQAAFSPLPPGPGTDHGAG